jgi:hypothetical protein
MTDCSICCEKFNLTDHKKVSCNYCELVCCRKCVQHYVTSITTDPHCMQCKNIWNREFIDSACTKVFRSKNLKSHRENILLEREKCFLPDTQVIVARRKERDRSINENITKIYELNNEISKLTRQNMLLSTQGDQVPETKERRKFVRKCPVTDCRGFLSTQWKCDICENNICHACNEIKDKDKEHTCNPEHVETMNLLKKDTKACPSCGTMIFKISGCAQMWCPDCHTAFNWNTLQIEKGVIHNPHFYEFQRLGGRTNRNAGDIPCGGMPDVNELYLACNMRVPNNGRYHMQAFIPNNCKIVFDFHRFINHVDRVEVPAYTYRLPHENNLELRVKYLINELTEEDFKSILQKNEKAREKLRDIGNILTMVVHTGTDILRQFVSKELTLENFTEIIVNLRDYTNETLQIISKRYPCVVPQIRTDTWDVERLKF